MKRDASQMTDKAIYRTNNLAVKRCLYQFCSERIVYISVFSVNGNSLNVTVSPCFGKKWLFQNIFSPFAITVQAFLLCFSIKIVVHPEHSVPVL